MTKSTYSTWILSVALVLACVFGSAGNAHAYMLCTTPTGAQVRWSSSSVTTYVADKLRSLSDFWSTF